MSSVLLKTTRLIAGAGMAMSLLFTAACDDDDDPFVPVATEFSITGGDNQNIAVNTASAPLTVTLLDQNDDPIANRTINWTIASGAGTLASATSTTNAQGVATMVFTSGTTTGAATVTASVAGSSGVAPLTFDINVQ